MAIRKYISPRKLRAIAFDVRKLDRERQENGLPPATSAQLSEWMGFSRHAIVAARNFALEDRSEEN